MITWIVQKMKECITFLKKLIDILYQIYFPKKKNPNEKSNSMESQTSVYTPAKPLRRAITCKKKSIQVVVKHFL